MRKVIVSSCLLGNRCRYNGKILKTNLKIKQLKSILAGCPEQLGGLPVPRPKSFIIDGTAKEVILGKAKVIDKKGKNVTKNFICGAKKVLNFVKQYKIKRAYLKSGSPSCGKNGVTAMLLKKYGVSIEWVK